MLLTKVSSEFDWPHMLFLEEMPFFYGGWVFVELSNGSGNELLVRGVGLCRDTCYASIGPHAVCDQINEPIEFILDGINRRNRICCRDQEYAGGEQAPKRQTLKKHEGKGKREI